MLDRLARLPREGFLLAACLLLVCIWLAPLARAQVGVSSLPSLYRVPWLGTDERMLRLSLSTGYGAFGDALHASDAHHRFLGGAGAGLTMRSGLALEGRIDGRYDAHVLKGKDDSGAVLDPRFTVRYVRAVGERFHAGAQASLWFPGRDFPKPAFDAATVDVTGLFGVRFAASTDLTLQAGYRIDQSDQAIEHPERLSRSDFMSLGLSSSDSVLAGVGVRRPYSERGAWFGEASADLLVGKKAPSVAESPMHLGVGVDQAIGTHGTRARVALNVALSSRPGIDVSGPLVPLEPRVWVVAGLTQDLLTPPAPASEQTAEIAEVTTPKTEPAATPVAAPAPEVVALPRGVLRVFVRDTDWGEAMEATVTARAQAEADAPVSGTTSKPDDGMIELSVAPGRYEVQIEAKGYATQRRTVVVDEGGVTVLNVDLRPKEGR